MDHDKSDYDKMDHDIFKYIHYYRSQMKKKDSKVYKKLILRKLVILCSTLITDWTSIFKTYNSINIRSLSDLKKFHTKI